MNRIKVVLEEKGIKPIWLAEKLGKSFNTVNSYVQNRQQPRLEKPVDEGRLPHIMLIRDGLHIVPWLCALVNITPRLASLSILGVFVSGCPSIHPIQSFKSSTTINNTLGRVSSWANSRNCVNKSAIVIGTLTSNRKPLFIFLILN